MDYKDTDLNNRQQKLIINNDIYLSSEMIPDQEIYEEEIFLIEIFNTLENVETKLEYFVLSQHYPEDFDEEIKLFIIQSASEYLMLHPRICSLALALITNLNFNIDDIDDRVIQNCLNLLIENGSKYKSIIEFLIKFSRKKKEAYHIHIYEYILKSFLEEDDDLFKFCISQFELGNIPCLSELDNILIQIDYLNNISFNSKQNGIILTWTVLTQNEENKDEWISNNLDFIIYTVSIIDFLNEE